MGMEAALRAIAEPHRRQILRLVWDSELSAGEIATHFEVSRPAVSQHLAVLRDVGLVSERRSGTRRLYRAEPGRPGRTQGLPGASSGGSGGAITLKSEIETQQGEDA